jgi:glucosaminylphosphatidylinositol acyltransferase
MDVLLNCGAMLACLTIYSKQPLLLNGLILLPALFTLITPKTKSTAIKKPSKAADNEELDPFPMKPFVTMYRGSMMIVTCIAILAVDFRVFPRRFAKVENWGTSLMDLGVGSFVFSAGVVSARSVLKARLNPKGDNLLNRLLASLRSSLALLAIGIIRMLSVRGVDYAVHETEYGTHWNFFFTLGLLPPFVAVFQSLFSLIPSYPLLALITATTYECVLDFTSLTAFIVTAPRNSFISSNREGICSFVGYLAIFLAGQGAGMFCLPRDQSFERGWLRGITAKKLWEQSKQSQIVGLGAHAILYSALFFGSTSWLGLNLHVSRRLANLPYVLWVCAFNSAQLVICILTEKYLFPNIYCVVAPSTSKLQAQASGSHPISAEQEKQSLKNATSTVLRAFNTTNGLVIFLVANLLTGAVNLVLPTLTMGKLESMAVLAGYITLLACLAVGLDVYGIKIKI